MYTERKWSVLYRSKLQMQNTEIDTSKIAVGDYIPNLREFCSLTNLEYKDSTNSRRAIKSFLSRFFVWEERGRGYLITAIKEIPDKKPYHGSDLFSQDIQTILAALYFNYSFDPLLTKTELLRICGFVNYAFRTDRDQQYKDLLSGRPLTNKQINFIKSEFENLVYGYCSKHLMSSLEKIEERKQITLEEEILVQEDINLNSKTSITIWRNASNKEMKAFEQIADRYKESKDIAFIGSFGWRKYHKYEQKVYQKLEVRNIRKFYHIYYHGDIAFNCFDEANKAYLQSVENINKKVLLYFHKKAPDQANKSVDKLYERHLEEYGITPETDLENIDPEYVHVPALMLSESIEDMIKDRNILTNAFITINLHQLCLSNIRQRTEYMSSSFDVFYVDPSLSTKERKEYLLNA